MHLALLAIVLFMSFADSTFAQVVSTVSPESSAGRVAEVLQAEAARAKWTFRRATCRDLSTLTAPAAILTTSDCLASIPWRAVHSISANVGVPMQCYGLGQKSFNLQGGQRIAILRSAQIKYEHRLSTALKAFGVHPIIDSSSRTLEELAAKLETHVVCVVDDGSGLGTAAVATSPQVVQLVPPGIQQPAMATETFAIVPEAFVSGPWTAASATTPTIVFPLPHSGKSLAPPTQLASISASFNMQPKGVPQPGAKEGMAPIFVAVGIQAELFAPAFQRAVLAAPLESLINPCQPGQQDMYRSFLRAAAKEAMRDEAAVALWEHAALLASRDDADPYYKRQVLHLNGRAVEVKDFISRLEQGQSGGSCPAPKKLWFVQPGKSGNYQFGIRRLREALRSPDVNTQSDAFKEASACLLLAFRDARDNGSEPTCGDRMSGMWTTYYAPYVALLIIQAERDARR